MTGSVKIASRVNAVVASEVQRAEDLALITGVLVARGLRPRSAERLPIDALAEVGVGERSGGVWAFRSRAWPENLSGNGAGAEDSGSEVFVTGSTAIPPGFMPAGFVAVGPRTFWDDEAEEADDD